MITEKNKQNIIKELGIENLPAEKAKEIMERLEENIQRKVVLEVLDLLSQADQKIVEELIKNEDNKKIQEFLSEKIPILDSLIKVVAESVVKEFKNYVRLNLV